MYYTHSPDVKAQSLFLYVSIIRSLLYGSATPKFLRLASWTPVMSADWFDIAVQRSVYTRMASSKASALACRGLGVVVLRKVGSEGSAPGYPRREKPRGHEHRSTIFMAGMDERGRPRAEKRNLCGYRWRQARRTNSRISSAGIPRTSRSTSSVCSPSSGGD